MPLVLNEFFKPLEVELTQLDILEPAVFLGGQEIGKSLVHLECIFGRQMVKRNLGTKEKAMG